MMRCEGFVTGSGITCNRGNTNCLSALGAELEGDRLNFSSSTSAVCSGVGGRRWVGAGGGDERGSAGEGGVRHGGADGGGSEGRMVAF